MNAERQAIEKAVQDSAAAQIESDRLHEDPVIVVAGEGWHAGVIGIVAGRLKDRFGKPVVVIATDEGVGKGSGRSISGVDLGRAISAARARGILVNGGGHAMAAGLTIAPDRIAELRRMLIGDLGASVGTALLNRERWIEGIVSPTAVNGVAASEIARAGPFGAGAPEPVFALSDMSIRRTRLVGAGHLAFEAVDPGGEAARAIAFRVTDAPLGALLQSAAEDGRRVWLLGKIRADDWRGGDAAQFQVIDAADMRA